MLACRFWSSSFSIIWLASSVICLSTSLRCSLYSLMSVASVSAFWKSRSTSRSTASVPFCMRPEALMRGPILKTMSLMVSSRPVSPQISIIDFSPTLGFWFSCFSPWKASMRFSPVTGTMSAAMETAQNSSSGMRREKGMPLFLAKACMYLKPTPHPQRCLKGYVESSRLGFSMATAQGSSSSGTWWSQMTKSMPRLLA